MDMHIFIASYDRSRVIEMSLAHIPKERRDVTHVMVRPGQKEQYERVLRDRVELLTLPEGNEGGANAWNHVTQYCIKNGIKKFVQMDDDIRSLVFRRGTDPDPEKWWRGFKQTPEEYLSFWDTMEHDLDTYAHGGIIQRQRLFTTREDKVLNTRATGIHFFFTEAMKRVQVNRTWLMEDFSQHLQLMLQGYSGVVYHNWAFDHIGFNTRGGQQHMRTKERQLEAVDKFVEDYPLFATKVMKTHKSRNNEEWPELRISWKKAAEWGSLNDWRGFDLDGPPR